MTFPHLESLFATAQSFLTAKHMFYSNSTTRQRITQRTAEHHSTQSSKSSLQSSSLTEHLSMSRTLPLTSMSRGQVYHKWSLCDRKERGQHILKSWGECNDTS